MSRATLHTDGAVFHANGEKASSGALSNTRAPRLKVAILGDFSGRQSRGECCPGDILNRPGYAIHKDNFSEVFSRLAIRLQLPICEAPVSFREFDDLHPDYLYSRVPLFQKFIDLNRKLLNPQQFEQAASEILNLLGPVQSPSGATAAVTAQTSDFTLESILSSIAHNAPYTPSADADVNRLIRSIVAPYVCQPDDPRQADLLAAVSQATNHTMRSIMHHSAYQQLEASWRSVQWLLKRLEVGSNIEIHLLDITQAELLADLQQADNDLEQAQIFHRLVTSQAAIGSVPYHLVLGDFYVTDTEEDLGLLIDMGTIAESAGSNFICGANSALAGFPSLAGRVDPHAQQPPERNFAQAWAAIQDYSGSQHVIAASPRFMLRQPYGKQTSTTDCFDFEELQRREELRGDDKLRGNEELGEGKELGEENNHRYYLWGNSGYLVTLLQCQYFLEGGTDLDALRGSTVEDLALHYYGADCRLDHSNNTDPSASGIKPCAETLLTDSVAQQFSARGLCTVRSVHNQDKVIIPRLNSLHFSGRLVTPWSSASDT